MKRWLQMLILLGVIAIIILPVQTNAYSYGDPNEEEVAETFKLVVASLSEATPNWTAAEEAYKVRRAEISSHFGEAVSATLDENFKSKDSTLLIANFKAVLVMNLERRFSHAKLDVEDYSKSKLLLAKALATFDTLTPYMDSKISENRQSFEDALDALGNPGLFGVGKKEAQPDVFTQKVDNIYESVKPLFTYKAYIKPATEKAVEAVKEPDIPAKLDTSKDPTNDLSQNTPLETPADPSVKEPDVRATAVEPMVEPEVAEPSELPIDSTDRVEDTATPAPNLDNAETVTIANEAHAPMEQTDKTNPLITVILITSVLIIGGGVVWIARNKGLL